MAKHYRLSPDSTHAPCGVRNARFMVMEPESVTCVRCKRTITDANPAIAKAEKEAA